MPPIGRPVHSVNLGKMPLQCPLCPHQLALGDRLVGLSSESTNCGVDESAVAVSFQFLVYDKDKSSGSKNPSIARSIKSGRGQLTRSVCKLLLFPLDPVLERLSLATCLLDASLHRFGRHVARPAGIHLCAVRCRCTRRVNWVREELAIGVAVGDGVGDMDRRVVSGRAGKTVEVR